MFVLLELDIPWENIDSGEYAYFGVVFQTIVLLYSFMGLAIICDDHLVPALDTLCYVWGIPEDVAGATFMAFGSAAPEIVIASVATAQAAMGGEEEGGGDATALGVSSVIGSGMIAFCLIPALCGLVQKDESPLILKRRPLLRDEFAYFFSLLALMYVIADGEVHTWEAALILVIYIIYLLVIVFSHSIRVWFIMEVMDQKYISTTANKGHGHGHGGHEEPLMLEADKYGVDEAMPIVGQETNVWKKYGPPVYVSFKQRPLGFTVEAGDGKKNAIVATIDEHSVDDPNFIEVGAQVMEIAGRSCMDLDFIEIQDRLNALELPLLIKFQTPPKELVDTWSNSRVRKWWQNDLPPACQQYVHIVDECQLDGSDLLDLDWEMLAEFSVKKIHGMKILKAIKNLMGSRQLLGTEVQRVVKQLEKWEVTPSLVSELKSDILGKFDGGKSATQNDHGHGGHGHGHGSDDGSHEEHGPCSSLWHLTAWPLEFLFWITCPPCEIGTPYQNYWPITFLVSFTWVALFSFCLSSVIERWVHVTEMPMAFFGLLLVSAAAQIPDGLESLAVARKGYGSMAVSNCLGTQTINIGLGLGLPWLITSSMGVVTTLPHELIVPCYFMLALICTTLGLYSFDIFIFKKPKVILNKSKSWILVIMYFVCVLGYAIYLIQTGGFSGGIGGSEGGHEKHGEHGGH